MTRSTVLAFIAQVFGRHFIGLQALVLTLLLANSFAADAEGPATDKLPALFLVGDSIVKTGKPPGDIGPWGWGDELIPLFDAKKIHVYNEGRGGHSSCGYIEEEAWSHILARLSPGDFVMIHFGHNDAKNSQNYPDRVTVAGNGDETQEIESPVTHQKEIIHTYGWYLRQYVKDA